MRGEINVLFFMAFVLAIGLFVILSKKRPQGVMANVSVLAILGLIGFIAFVGYQQSKSLTESQQFMMNRISSQKHLSNVPDVEALVRGGDRSVEVKVSREGVSVAAGEMSVSTKGENVPQTSGPDAWSPGIEREFKLHLYPSAESAVVATCELMLSELDESMPTDAKPELHMYVSQDFYCDASSLAVVLRQKLPVADVRIVSKVPTEGVTGVILLYLDNPQSVNETGTVRTIEATMFLADKRLTRQAQFINKPWIEDSPRWSDESKLSKPFYVARSYELSLTQKGALDQARQKVTQRLFAEIKRRLWRKGYQFDTVWVQSEIATIVSGTHQFCHHMSDGPVVVDQFVQRFDRPYGQVYRAALLVNESQRNIIDITYYFRRQLDEQSHVQRKTFISTVLSAMGLLAVICVVYLFLNAATRGYYVWSIRIAAIVLIVAGIGVVFYFV